MKQCLLGHPPARVLRSLAKLHQFEKDPSSKLLFSLAAEAVVDLVGMPAERAPKAADPGVRVIRERLAGASGSLPQLGKGVFQQRQVPGFSAHIRKQGVDQAALRARRRQCQPVLDRRTL